MKSAFIILFTLFHFSSYAQVTDSLLLKSMTDTAAIDLKYVSIQITAGETSNYFKARKLLHWLSSNFQWKATDYQTRSVKEILVRKGGNCFELAKVYMALIKELDIQYRPIAEINIQKPNEERAKDAAELIKERGKAFSLFGYQHNDHRWVEIYDEEQNIWVPLDPTLDILGFDEWLKARAWFGERHTINDEFSNDMVVPFAIYVVDKIDKHKIVEDRTKEYLIVRLNELYNNRLSRLPSWKKWEATITKLNKPSMNALAGTENLHHYTGKIRKLASIYQELKKEYTSIYQDKNHR